MKAKRKLQLKIFWQRWSVSNFQSIYSKKISLFRNRGMVWFMSNIMLFPTILLLYKFETYIIFITESPKLGEFLSHE